jgi:hypothetical protein
MTSYQDIEAQVLADLDGRPFDSDEVTKILSNFKAFHSVKPKPEPAPTPEPEPEPQLPWWDRHGDALIKGAFGLMSVLSIVGGEKLGEHIYNTKAWGTVPK